MPDMGVDVNSREAVDAAHTEAVPAGHDWGVRRFVVRYPQVSSSACWPTGRPDRRLSVPYPHHISRQWPPI